MTKGEMRKIHKQEKAEGKSFTCHNNSVEFGPERYSNGRYNHRRAKALQKYARFIYDHDRD